MNNPPLGESHWPVKNELSSEAKKSAVAATSRGVPKRPMGVRRFIIAMNVGEKKRIKGVSMNPGQRAFTRIFREATSWASDRVNPRIPALAAE
jgi:hypothetical protein